MSEVKNILVIAGCDKVEALRMATGLTLLDDFVTVMICGELENTSEAEEQIEALDFSDVPIHRLKDDNEIPQKVAAAIVKADVVYML